MKGLQAHKERWKWRGAYTYVRVQGCIYTYVRVQGCIYIYFRVQGCTYICQDTGVHIYRCTEIEMYRDADT